ncbi:MAG: BatD family protein [Candidatus Calescibacterium sp.]|nr:BatD family protein [Candidatus Calescibacterium sp.]MDW8132068.1 BatD family protein [Candidatus Calescibacterium sp.]
MMSFKNKMNNFWLLLLVSLYFFLTSFTDNYGNIVEISPQASKNIVGLGENFYLTIHINFKSPSNTTWYVEDNFKLLKIEEFLSNFNVISRSIDRKITQTNNYDIMDLTYTFVLQARQEGDFVLKDIGLMYSIDDNNQKVSKFAPMDNSKSITIKVISSYVTQPQPQPHQQPQPQPYQQPQPQPQPYQQPQPQPYQQPQPQPQPYQQPQPQPYQQPHTTYPPYNPTTTNPTTSPTINPPTSEPSEFNWINVALILLASIIVITIVGVGLYWLYKILNTSTQTVEKQETQDLFITVDKFSSPSEKIIEKINPIDYSKINFNSKIEEINRDLKMKKYSNIFVNLVVVGQYMVQKINKLMNENNLRDSIDKLNFIGKSDISRDIMQVYTEIIELSLYDFDENNPTKIPEDEIEKRVTKLIEQLKYLNNTLSTLKV